MKTQTILTKFLFFCSFFFVLNANAQAFSPEKFSFQAVVRNSSNQLIANQNIGLRISILSVVMGSENAEFIETHTATTNQNGLFSIQIGNGTNFSGALSTAMNSSAQSKKIKCEIDPNGGNNYTIVSSEPLLSVPYALKSNSAVYANNADFATTATTASTATSANSVVGIAGNKGFVPVFGDNNALGNSAVFNDTESGNVGIHNQNPLVALDVAGNGTILARKRIVLGPVGGNPFISPIWAMDNTEYNFRIFKQLDLSTPGTTHFTINSNGNASMSNNLSVAGDITTNQITAGDGSSLGNMSYIGRNSVIGAGSDIVGTNSLQVGIGGSQISKILFGTANIGSSSGYFTIRDVVFPTPMPNSNYVVSLTIVQQDGTFDLFTVWCRNKTANGFKIFVKRDDDDSWGQNLNIDWMVIQPK
jgi:hypothetical protein